MRDCRSSRTLADTRRLSPPPDPLFRKMHADEHKTRGSAKRRRFCLGATRTCRNLTWTSRAQMGSARRTDGASGWVRLTCPCEYPPTRTQSRAHGRMRASLTRHKRIALLQTLRPSMTTPCAGGSRHHRGPEGRRRAEGRGRGRGAVASQWQQRRRVQETPPGRRHAAAARRSGGGTRSSRRPDLMMLMQKSVMPLTMLPRSIDDTTSSCFAGGLPYTTAAEDITPPILLPSTAGHGP